MNKFFKIFAGGIILLASGPLTASAQSINSCTCLTPPVSNSQVLGQVVLASGQVSYSGANGFENATSGTQLVNGSELAIGENSTANISVGQGCALNVAPNSLVSVYETAGAGSDICVNVTNLAPQIPSETVTQSSTAAEGAAAILGVGLVVGGVIMLTGGDDGASN